MLLMDNLSAKWIKHKSAKFVIYMLSSENNKKGQMIWAKDIGRILK